jgi:hypothetical protein
MYFDRWQPRGWCPKDGRMIAFLTKFRSQDRINTVGFLQ